jgi:hypothetical protein
MEVVRFIDCQTGDDLIVAFACVVDEFGEIQSLILLRTPKYEFVFHDSERGVSVNFESDVDDERDLLQEVAYDKAASVIRIQTQFRTFDLDVGKVDPSEIKTMRRTLRKMNFDNRLKLSGV